MIEGWKYYNHAAIPTTAPHEAANLDPINDGSIWNLGGGVFLYLLDGSLIGTVALKRSGGTA